MLLRKAATITSISKQFAPKPKPYIAGNIATSLRLPETGESIEVFVNRLTASSNAWPSGRARPSRYLVGNNELRRAVRYV